MQERRPIPGYDGYFADIYGHIWSNKFNKWRQLKEGKTRPGYHQVCLHIKKNGKNIQVVKKVAPLVAKAFLGIKHEKREACHNDGNKSNNKPWNLRYGTAKSNAKDRIKHRKNLPNLKLQTQLF